MTTNLSDGINQQITRKVADFYERFPYPFYSLMARPYHPDAYWSSSRALATLASELTGHPCGVLAQTWPSREQHVLVLGCGDTQPYLFKKWEPNSHHLSFLDLSDKSLKRARLRFGIHMRRINWIQADLCKFLSMRRHDEALFSHIDAYGVLHHLAEPSLALKLIAENLNPAGTLKLMVYNQSARDWIVEISKVFKLCKLEAYNGNDRALAKQLLKELAKLPSLSEFFAGVGPSIYTNENRLCDTFFNAREVSWLPEKWISALKESGLTPLSLFDRYGELDDLVNPLWSFPSKDQIQERCDDRRFENNLEILAIKPLQDPLDKPSPCRNFSNLQVSNIPKKWFDYLETKNISNKLKAELWQSFYTRISDPSRAPITMKSASEISLTSLKRLARLGAIFPDNGKTIGVYREMMEPICQSMEAPFRPAASSMHSNLQKEIRQILKVKDLDERRFLPLISERVLRINRERNHKFY
ncbi:MAG: class I SAM-dependent methyltransferase [Oligoflexales bacterium]|nr:class I SAM-dependent methyltransferase [Oligoflexales bacterium]